MEARGSNGTVTLRKFKLAVNSLVRSTTKRLMSVNEFAAH